MYPIEYLYHPGHYWLSSGDADIVRIGITDFAQRELEEVVFVELPSISQTFEAGESIGSAESIKATVDLCTPVSGEVVEINEALVGWPALFNEDPHAKGWMIRLQLSSSEQLNELLSADAYQRHVNGQS